jgi:basic membrane protein A and related proteins
MQQMVKRVSAVAVLGAALAGLIFFSGCGSSTTSTSAGASSENCKAPKIALIVNSNLGDGGFYDETNRAISGTAKELGLCEQTIETGPDPTKWEPALEEASSGEFDVIAAGSFEMLQLVEHAAEQHPEKEYILFDVAAECGEACPNIYSIEFRYDQNGYLAGALAALMTTDTSIPRINSDNTVGFVGGQEIPVIQEYREGYFEGVKSVDPGAKILSAYAGSFTDPVKGKALATEMISQGADVIFTASGATDKGVLEATSGGEAWTIGNSKTQALVENSIAGKEAVITSVGANVGVPLSAAVRDVAKGDLQTGTVGAFGVKEKAISIVDSPSYEKYIPDEIRKEAKQIEEEFASKGQDESNG